MNKSSIFVYLTVFTMLYACSDLDIEEPQLIQENSPFLPNVLYNYESAYLFPQHVESDPLLSIIASNFEPSNNPLTNAGATLGRVLFYDTKLSSDNAISCASCHKPSEGFSDQRVQSIGVGDQMTSRNSMGLTNLRFNNRMFWDIRTNGLENQILLPIQDPKEMGSELEDLIIELTNTDYYPELFLDAFGDSTINELRIAQAIAQFIRSMTSFNSKYDLGKQSDFSNFSDLENEGMELFFSGDVFCNHCHSSQNFYSLQALNNGLDVDYEDEGLFLVSGDEEDRGKFKVPTLRNIEFTAPYMHDGRFETLEEVIEHYNSGVQSHMNLDDRLTVEGQTGGTPENLNLSEQQKNALVAFLKTLSEPDLFEAEKFSDPFRP